MISSCAKSLSGTGSDTFVTCLSKDNGATWFSIPDCAATTPVNTAPCVQDRKRVTVDAAGYREERREMVERQADRAAERAMATDKEIELEPMSPTERRLVHQHLKDRPGIETFSEGEEPDRCVIVAPLVSD